MGLLDIDICGPSVPKMMGLEGQEIHQSAAGWSPVYVDTQDGTLGVMSIGERCCVVGCRTLQIDDLSCCSGITDELEPVFLACMQSSSARTDAATTVECCLVPVKYPMPSPSIFQCGELTAARATHGAGFMLPNSDDPVIWRGPRKNGLIKQFMKDVHWGELDYLVVDTPPGTSDEHISVRDALVMSVTWRLSLCAHSKKYLSAALPPAIP